MKSFTQLNSTEKNVVVSQYGYMINQNNDLSIRAQAARCIMYTLDVTAVPFETQECIEVASKLAFCSSNY